MTTYSLSDLVFEPPVWKTSLEETNYPEIQLAQDTIDLVAAALPKLSTNFIHFMATKHRQVVPISPPLI